MNSRSKSRGLTEVRKSAENQPFLREKSKPTAGTHGGLLDQKTASGKKRASRNAIKMGFYSKWLLVDHLAGKDSQGEYADFHADIFKHYRPWQNFALTRETFRDRQTDCLGRLDGAVNFGRLSGGSGFFNPQTHAAALAFPFECRTASFRI